MKISAVLTTYNDEKKIVSVLDNIVNQTFSPHEIVIADGGSKDKTVLIICDYADSCRIPIKVISDGKRRNIAAGFNDAIKASKDKWVIIMATGNRYDEDFMANMVNEQKKTNTQLVYGSIMGVESTRFAHYFNQYFLSGNKPQDMGPNNHGLLIHKDIFDDIGYFWEHFIYAGEDYEYARRIKKNMIKCCYSQGACAYWETPGTWDEYLKKMEVNSIGEWQIRSRKEILKLCAMQIVILSIFFAMVIRWPVSFMMFAPLMVLVGLKKRTISIPSILLGLFNRYLMIYYYIKNRKYGSAQYHIPKEYQI